MLPRLTRRFRVATYDARGHGLSAKPSSGYGFDPVVADARAVIRSVALRRPIVVGHSWGAMVALELAARHPHLVEGAVLVDGGIGTLRGDDGLGDREAAVGSTASRRHARGRVPPDDPDVPRRSGRGHAADRGDRCLGHERRSHTDGSSLDSRGRTTSGSSGRSGSTTPMRRSHASPSPPSPILARGGGDPEWDERKRRSAERAASSGAPVRISWMKGIHDLPLQHPDALAGRIERFSDLLVR